MKQKKTIGSSIGLLTGAVIAILALVRGPWQLPLLIGTFAVWGLWLLWTQVLPFRRALQAQRRREQAESFNRSLAQTLLHHVNYRVSACLKASYPDARWEWMVRDPALFVVQGGTGRIRVFGIPDYEYADVTVDQSGKDVAVVALDSMLAAYYEGKQIALHRISYQRSYGGPRASPAKRVVWGEEEGMERTKSSPQAGTQQSGISSDEVVNPQHYRRLTLKQTIDAENVLLEQGKAIDFPLKLSDLSRYDEVLYE